MSFDYERLNKFLADNQRPYTTYILSTAIGIACLIPSTAPIAIPVAGAALGVSVASRSVEAIKKTSADAEVKKENIKAGNDTTISGA